MDNKGIQINLHDLNKAVIQQLPNIEKETAINLLKDYVNKIYSFTEYLMLLSNENRDYTVIKLDKENNKDKQKHIDLIAEELCSIILTRGEIKDIDTPEHEDCGEATLDIWTSNGFYKMFNYNWGVVNI